MCYWGLGVETRVARRGGCLGVGGGAFVLKIPGFHIHGIGECTHEFH